MDDTRPVFKLQLFGQKSKTCSHPHTLDSHCLSVYCFIHERQKELQTSVIELIICLLCFLLLNILSTQISTEMVVTWRMRRGDITISHEPAMFNLEKMVLVHVVQDIAHWIKLSLLSSETKDTLRTKLQQGNLKVYFLQRKKHFPQVLSDTIVEL